MASLPSQRPQRRASPSQQHVSPERSPEPVQRAQSTTSVDSQTVFLNTPTSASPPAATEQKEAASTLPQERLEEPRKCWICFSDETEDTPESSVWRSPCPCALTAHEACLLDWVADIEAPNNSRSVSAQTKLACPQCKAEIKLSRPHSFIVDGLSAVEKYTSQALLPTIVSGLTVGIMLGCSAHGAHAIRTVFGHEDSEAILRPVGARHDWEKRVIADFPTFFKPFFQNWRGLRTEIGIPLIPLCLIASRTRLADAALPIIPFVFLGLREDIASTIIIGDWPPSREVAFMFLPVVRGIYNSYLEHVWGERERGWMNEVQPRHRTNADDEEEIWEDDPRFNRGDGLGVDVQLEFEIGNDDSDDEGVDVAPPAANAANEQAQPGNAPPAANNDQQQVQPQNEHQHPLRAAGANHETVISLTRIASTTLGALLFPDVSALAGGLLYYALPAYLTSPRFYRGKPVATGLLQTRWGRTLIGGCLFVALKDAVRIYCRWRMAKAHRERRVVDYDGPRRGPALESRSGVEVHL